MILTPLLAKRYSSKWMYYAWLVIVIGLIIPFRPSFGFAAVQIELPQSAGQRARVETPANQVLLEDAPAPTIAYNPPSPSIGDSSFSESLSSTGTARIAAASTPWAAVLAAIWLSGAFIVLVCHVIRHKRFIKSIWRWGEDVKDSRTLGIWQAVRSEMNITAQVGLQRSELTGSPLLTGILYPRIMLPKTDMPDDELALVLIHELVHYKRKDLWYKGLVLLAVAIHWFNPMVYIVAKTISLQCERSCDDEVVKHKDKDSRFEYSTAIIHSIRYAESTTALSTSFFGGKKEMKNRISSIMDMSRKRRGTLIICAVLAASLVTGLAVAVNAGELIGAPPLDPAQHETFTTGQIQAAMAGNWRSQRHDGYTANDLILSLFVDGSWEQSGPLSTDHVDGGRFSISGAEGIYHLTLIVEHSTSPYVELGLELHNILSYDMQNDRLSQQEANTENPGEMITVWYIRVPHAARDAAPTWNEDGLTANASGTPDGLEYRFDAMGFSLTLPDSWDGYYQYIGGDEGYFYIYFDSMGVFANLFMISAYDAYSPEILESGEFEIIRIFDAGSTRYMMYIRPIDRSLVLGTEDFSSFGWELDDEMNQHIRITLRRMYHESDTIVADSIR